MVMIAGRDDRRLIVCCGRRRRDCGLRARSIGGTELKVEKNKNNNSNKSTKPDDHSRNGGEVTNPSVSQRAKRYSPSISLWYWYAMLCIYVRSCRLLGRTIVRRSPTNLWWAIWASENLMRVVVQKKATIDFDV